MSPEVSVIVPLYNEAPNVLACYERTRDAMDARVLSFELLFVDDGSSDDTYARVCSIHRKDSRVRAIRLARNFGQQMALRAGLRAATGACCAFLDGDLQCPPEAIPRMYDALQANKLAVFGLRRQHHKSPLRRIAGVFVEQMMIAAFDAPPEDPLSCFVIFRARVAPNVCAHRSRFPLALAAILHECRGKIGTVEVEHGERQHGTSKYGVARQVHLIITLLFNLPAQHIALIVAGVALVSLLALMLHAIVGAVLILLFIALALVGLFSRSQHYEVLETLG